MPSQPPKKALQSFSWVELSKHNSTESAWIAVRGKVYDISAFLDRHPGGKDVLLFSAGRDTTQVFETYHDFHVYEVLKKFYIGELVDNELPVFPEASPFFRTLKERINNYFKETNQDPKFARYMYLRYVIIYFTVALSWYSTFFVPTVANSIYLQCFMSIVLGFFCAQIGLNPLHDASHFTITHKPWLWKVIGATHDFLNGASYVVWIYQHMLGHHPYTNIAGADPDITTGDPDLRRIKPSQRWFKHYVNQQFFVPFLYGLLGIKTRIQDVSIIYFSKTNDNIRVNEMTTWHTMVFWLGKAFFVLYRLVLPTLTTPISTVFGLFLLSDLVCSYWLALTFQANHVVEETVWPIPNEKNELDIDWATMQIATTQDYAHDSNFWTISTGALNYQTVHHLFPQVSQYYYPQIAGIIKEICKEFGVNYLVKETIFEAIASHYNHLRILGLSPNNFEGSAKIKDKTKSRQGKKTKKIQ